MMNIQDDELQEIQKNAKTLCYLSKINYYGIGVPKNYLRAKKRLEIAAQYLIESQYALGLFYCLGIGVRQDKKKAKEYFEKTCDSGYQKGCDAYRKPNEEGI